jgi:hypothetical protein
VFDPEFPHYISHLHARPDGRSRELRRLKTGNCGAATRQGGGGHDGKSPTGRCVGGAALSEQEEIIAAIAALAGGKPKEKAEQSPKRTLKAVIAKSPNGRFC